MAYVHQMDLNMRKILDVLKDGGWMSVKDVTEATGLHRQTVAKKLEALVFAGLVETNWLGRARVFRLKERVEGPQTIRLEEGEVKKDEWGAV